MFAVNLVIYAAFLSGIFILGEKEFSAVRKKFYLRRRLNSEDAKPKGKVYLWFEQLLQAALAKEVDTFSFLTFLGFLFVFVFILAVRNLLLIPALICALIVTGLPVLWLLVRVENARTRGSKEGVSLVTEFYRQYRMKNLNVYEAISATIDAEGDFPNCRKQLYRLLLRLRSSGSPGEIRQALDAFAYALGTTWGRMFATCIRLSVEKGDDVSEGLQDIIKQLNNASAMAEDRKRLNSEAARMTMFLVPALYVGTMMLAVYYLDVSPSKLIRNQFLTPEGFLFFMAIVILFVFNSILLKLVDNTRLDY